MLFAANCPPSSCDKTSSHTGGPIRMFSRLDTDAQVKALAGVHASDPIAYSFLADASGGRLPASVEHLLAGVRPAHLV